MYLKTHRYDRYDSMELKESIFSEFYLPDHFHDTFCIGLLQSGMKAATVEGSPLLIHAHSVSIVNPYQVHSDKNIDLADCHYKMIYVNRDVVNYFADKLTGRTDTNVLFTNELITDEKLVHAVMRFFEQPEVESLLDVKLKQLFDCLFTRYRDDVNSPETKVSINAIKDSMENARLHFADKIDIGKMAASCKLSKFQFIRSFKKLTGLTPASYILVSRINYAKAMILKQLPVGQVALEAGFYDHAQFCKYFKYYTNLSPVEYKRHCNIVQAS